MERMGGEGTANMNHTADRLNGANAEHPALVRYTPEQEELRLHGLRILARMIVKAYLRKQDRLQGTDSEGWPSTDLHHETFHS